MNKDMYSCGIHFFKLLNYKCLDNFKVEDHFFISKWKSFGESCSTLNVKGF